MKIIRLGIIVETSISNSEYDRYKTELGELGFVSRELDKFVAGLDYFNGLKVGFVDIGNHDMAAINDFNYSINNQVEKSKDGHVYRSFGNALYLLVDKDLEYTADIYNRFMFDNGKRKFLIIVVSVAERSEKDKSIKSIGGYKSLN